MSHPPDTECHPIIYELMDRISSHFKVEINSVLINRYIDGNSFIPWHQDDETCLGENPTIFSLSLGGSRVFEIKKSEDYSKINAPSLKQFDLHDGTLVVMKGEIQKYFYHRVPMEPSNKTTRLNLTFRHIKAVAE